MGVEVYTYRNVRTGQVVVRPERSARLDSKPDVWELLVREPTQEPKVERVKPKEDTAPKGKSRSSSRRSTARKTSSR
jgi:hypothetical protein